MLSYYLAILYFDTGDIWTSVLCSVDRVVFWDAMDGTNVNAQSVLTV